MVNDSVNTLMNAQSMSYNFDTWSVYANDICILRVQQHGYEYKFILIVTSTGKNTSREIKG